MRCPFEFFEQTRHMGFVIQDTELGFNHFGHAGTRPDFTAKAIGFGTMRQEIWNESFLCFRKSRRCPRMRTRIQRFLSLGLHGSHPLTDSTGRHTQRFGNVLLFPAVLLEIECTPTSNFFPVLSTHTNDGHATFVAWPKKFSKLCNGH